LYNARPTQIRRIEVGKEKGDIATVEKAARLEGLCPPLPPSFAQPRFEVWISIKI
jgi:hypothetical protein